MALAVDAQHSTIDDDLRGRDNHSVTGETSFLPSTQRESLVHKPRVRIERGRGPSRMVAHPPLRMSTSQLPVSQLVAGSGDLRVIGCSRDKSFTALRMIRSMLCSRGNRNALHDSDLVVGGGRIWSMVAQRKHRGSCVRRVPHHIHDEQQEMPSEVCDIHAFPAPLTSSRATHLAYVLEEHDRQFCLAQRCHAEEDELI